MKVLPCVEVGPTGWVVFGTDKRVITAADATSNITFEEDVERRPLHEKFGTLVGSRSMIIGGSAACYEPLDQFSLLNHGGSGEA